MESRPISPAEPANKHPPSIQPNAHPYAIKTTSSALLSRSNSSPHSAHHIRHHYVPSSRIQMGGKVRHHHSSSLSSIEVKGHGDSRTAPVPLPAPPSPIAALSDVSLSLKPAEEPRLTHRVRRAETMPCSSAAVTTTRHHGNDQKLSYNPDLEPALYADLPPNPKLWSTDELTTYLETSLGSASSTGGNKGDPLADILKYVRTCGLTGRELLRLTDADLAGTPLSDAQRTQLLERSRLLRAGILRGRIYIDSYHLHEVSKNSNDIYPRSSHISIPCHSVRGASASVDDLRLLLENANEDGLPPSPAMSLRRSNSVSDASAQRYRDLAHMRARRRGKVKGLIETWERTSTSGSECSASEEESVGGSGVESESEADRELEAISSTRHSPMALPDLPSAVYNESLHHDYPSTANSTTIDQERPSSTPPLPYTHTHIVLRVPCGEEEEPSIEELLASSSSVPLKGARAWEADFGLGETVKRAPVSTGVDAGSISLTSLPQNDSGQSRADSVQFKGTGMRGTTGNRGKSVKAQKRVVTAIFTGSPSGDVPDNGGGIVVHSHRSAESLDGVIHDRHPARSDPQDDPDSVVRALEESLAATRAQVEAFRLRLEGVEADTARREAEWERAQHSNPRSLSGTSRQRSKVNEQATSGAMEPSRDETPSEGLRNEDVLRGLEILPLGDIARTIIARAMVWMFPFGHVGVSAREKPKAHTASCPEVNDACPSPAKRSGHLSVAHMSCSIILVSFAICAAVLRRMGFGRWVPRP